MRGAALGAFEESLDAVSPCVTGLDELLLPHAVREAPPALPQPPESDAPATLRSLCDAFSLFLLTCRRVVEAVWTLGNSGHGRSDEDVFESERAPPRQAKSAFHRFCSTTA